jgi:hypothetical protein
VRTTDDSQATVTLDPVNQQDRTVSVALRLELTFILPPQDEHLPQAIEAHVHRAGLEDQWALPRALIEHADRQLVVARRGGKAGRGIQLRGILLRCYRMPSSAARPSAPPGSPAPPSCRPTSSARTAGSRPWRCRWSRASP